MTQNEALLAYLKKHPKGITTLEAFVELGICRLSERIRELEGSAEGYYGDWAEYPHFFRKRVKVQTRTGHAYVTRYSLA